MTTRVKASRTIILSIILFILLPFLFYHCAQSRIERTTIAVDKLSGFQFSGNPFIKIHMASGEAFIFSAWKTDDKNKIINGTGKHFDLNRVIIDSGNYSIPYEKIVLVETNKIKEAGQLIALGILSGASLSLTAFCITNPKACFGSCPTFYVYDENGFKLQAEGFSSSVAPFLEDHDIDALYNFTPGSNILDIQVRNEALETHVIRHVNVLALSKPANGRVLSTTQEKFYQVFNFIPLESAEAKEGDCTNKLLYFDNVERFSEADSNNLAESEVLYLEFNNLNHSPKGLVISCRQTLLSTFLFYQTLAYTGNNLGYYFSQAERSQGNLRSFITHPGEMLNYIEIFQQNSSGDWIKINETGETGPIASDIKVIPLNRLNEEKELKLKLRMTRGMWRIDYAALADIGKEVFPEIIKPLSSSPQNINNHNLINSLNNDSLLVTLPGDNFNLYYELPYNYSNYEYFIESRGYYLEWMRDVWLAEENHSMIAELVFNPDKYFKDLAPLYKKIEGEMEKAFWRSKYVNP